MTAPITAERLAEIEAEADGSCSADDRETMIALVAEVRRLTAEVDRLTLACAVPGLITGMVRKILGAVDGEATPTAAQRVVRERGAFLRARDEAVAEVRRLTAALDAVTAERDALLAVCERFAGDEGVICNGYEDDSGCGSCGANANHSDADPANHAPDCARLAARVLAAKIRTLPLDAPGGAT